MEKKKRIKDCSFLQLYSFCSMRDDYKNYIPESIAFFLLHYDGPKSTVNRNKALKTFMKDIKPELVEKKIIVDVHYFEANRDYDRQVERLSNEQ